MNEYSMFIKEILEEVNPYEDFDDNTDLINSGLLDSLTIVFLVTRLEEEYDISIDEKLVVPDNFKNINKIVDLLKNVKNN